MQINAPDTDWGFYANAARGKRRKAARVGGTTQASGRQDDEEFIRQARLTWAKLMPRLRGRGVTVPVLRL